MSCAALLRRQRIRDLRRMLGTGAVFPREETRRERGKSRERGGGREKGQGGDFLDGRRVRLFSGPFSQVQGMERGQPQEGAGGGRKKGRPGIEERS